MKESDVQLAICDYLALKKHFFWRNNSYGIFDTRTGGHRRPQKYHRNGVPDIIVIKDGWFIGLEVKAPKGKISPAQKEFREGCQKAMGEYHVVRSIDDVIEIGL